MGTWARKATVNATMWQTAEAGATLTTTLSAWTLSQASMGNPTDGPVRLAPRTMLEEFTITWSIFCLSFQVSWIINIFSLGITEYLTLSYKYEPLCFSCMASLFHDVFVKVLFPNQAWQNYDFFGIYQNMFKQKILHLCVFAFPWKGKYCNININAVFCSYVFAIFKNALCQWSI